MHETALKMPEDDFYPLPRYEKRFGDPRSAKNRRLGHTVSWQGGILGVIVPGDDGEQPFKIARTVRDQLSKKQEEQCGVHSDSEADEEIAESKFANMLETRTDAYSAAATGVSRVSSLLQEAAEAVAEEDTAAVQKPRGKAQKQAKAIQI